MFRISKSEAPNHTVITVDGQLSGGCVEAVERLCDQETATGIPVQLFLRDLTVIDPAGRELLKRLAAKGIRLLGRGVYTSHIVKTLTSNNAGGD